VSLERLTWLRALVPGGLILVLAAPIQASTLDPGGIWARLSMLKLDDYLPAILIGFLYIALNLRGPVLRTSSRRFDNNIKDRLLSACQQNPLVAANTAKLRKGQTLGHVFFGLVDRDSSLTEKAKRVRFNGLMWTSAADLITLGTIGVVVYLAAAFLTGKSEFLAAMLVIAGVVLVAAFVLMPVVIRRHLSLSNDQLEYIGLRLRKELCSELERISRELR
jgi:hypothetical protein